ncbi:hypothetical protein AcW1_002722 [Taiwanofungus camphoratus]|nr:hypothetical protein AcV5_009603 [Antrodia cinnamomea]KAI0942965.1 hypothetical protein AcV7_002239 [Antrodia cinnamomea]KAI0943592.1 hypothetical protein AcW1_002722 [Antrodia cinnamomea]
MITPKYLTRRSWLRGLCEIASSSRLSDKDNTNVAVADTAAFLRNFTEFAAKTLSKPSFAVAVSYTHNKDLAFAGTVDPALLLTVVSVGNLGPEQNERISKAFAEYFKETLGVPVERGYIVFADPGSAYIGFKAGTVATVYGA